MYLKEKITPQWDIKKWFNNNYIFSTSLAKIFSNSSQADEDHDKTSLKYVPPLPAQPTANTSDNKSTHCLYASALYAYEW